MECSVTQFGVSEFCETLTGGFTRKTPRRSNSQKSENLEEWNTQSGGIARGVELPVDSLLPFIKSRNQWEPEPVGAGTSGIPLVPALYEGQGGGTPRGWNSQGGGTLKGVELLGGWNSQVGGTPRRVELPGGWNSQGSVTLRGVELPGSGTLSKANSNCW